MTLVHTADEALSTFKLVSGAGSEDTKTGCAMTVLSWMRGLAWTDSMECAHPVIRNNVIAANDDSRTTPEMRAELVKAGETGVIDTWWIPTEVVAWALSIDRESEVPSQYDRTLMMLKLISEWKAGPKVRPYLARANLARANLAGANLAGAYLADANLARANLAGANLAGANLAGANLAGAYLADANLADANLADANLARAYGTPSTGVPAGWEINKFGLYVKKAS